ncbi:MAG: hypothetical protein JNM38_11180, partial [Acidobacteria bacterium]|nr:hypothetical protein [Acidobacteriota bacterium]
MADRRRLLFLTQRVPYAPNRGDRLRAWHFLRELDREFAVDVGALVHDDEEAARIHDVPAERVVTGRVPRAANLA